MNTEYRVVCGNWPGEGHDRHIRPSTSEKAAVQSKIDFDHNSDLVGVNQLGAGDYYGGEGPWTVQSRTVSDWEDTDE